MNWSLGSLYRWCGWSPKGPETKVRTEARQWVSGHRRHCIFTGNFNFRVATYWSVLSRESDIRFIVLKNTNCRDFDWGEYKRNAGRSCWEVLAVTHVILHFWITVIYKTNFLFMDIWIVYSVWLLQSTTFCINLARG